MSVKKNEWVADDAFGGTVWSGDECVMQVWSVCGTHGETMRIARLAAAAPEMLIALYRALPFVQEDAGVTREVLAAIAKAEGAQ